MSDFRQAAIDAILEDLDFDSVKELRAYVSKNKQDDYFYGGILYAINAVQDLSSAQPESEERTAESAQNVPNDELISKKAAMDAHCELCEDKGLCGDICPDVEVFRLIPSAQPERLTDDDFETIRIHLNAYKEKLGNQHRWKEAEEYQRIIDRFMSFASAQPERTGKWILCSEKLPEANGRYLVTRGLVAAGALWNRVYIANYSDLMGIKSVKIWWQGNVGKSDFERLDDVLAWMPLPEPYRKENR